ncbi:ribosomal small subunit pseudouridine synthase A [Amphibacillus marinus]|uniref:Pseudouridine synthase n=1 Tax=Amphibacillus marinus TaxID=872970 RepID=A0A1H8SZ21_9BACI|nr:pseudouridine synthase [Amphibacillus marinus]SEO83716.1 ribosomal small subunit pseudouridine synthase A [Amphibacillus marinus]
MRLDKLISNSGFGSRKEVKQLLKSGAVAVNNEIIKDGKYQVSITTDQVYIGQTAVEYEEFVYFVLNKPAGVISATEDNRDRTVLDLLAASDRIKQPFPVGRLDKDTEGLLLITNDGKLAHQLLSPNKNVGKTYYADIEGVVTMADVKQFNVGVYLDDDYLTKPALLEILQSDQISQVNLTITEGKYHQVKRMFEAVGKRVVYLKRVAIGEWLLDEQLETGAYRRLTIEEINYLKGLS